jgi:hypothetical protein
MKTATAMRAAAVLPAPASAPVRRLRVVGRNRTSAPPRAFRRRKPEGPSGEAPARTAPADPWRAVARTRRVRGRAVLLEADLAAALGTLPGRLADLAWRHPDWFGEPARFALTDAERAEQGLPAGGLPPVAYTADGLVAAAHWLANEARREADAYAEAPDLAERLRIAWSVLGAGGGRA